MDRSWYFRLGLVVGALALSAYLLFPSYYYFFEATQEERDDDVVFCKALPTWAHCARLNLGLDLQGGVHLVMGVEVEKAVQHRLDRVADSLRDGLKAKSFAFTKLERARGGSELKLELAEGTDAGAVEKLLRQDYSVLDVHNRNGNVFTMGLLDKEANDVRKSAVEQTIKTIRNRADKLGVTEPTIARRGADQVLIQLPGVKDPDRAIDIIGRTAQLEFRIVDEQATAVFDTVDTSALPAGVEKKEGSVDGGNGGRQREVYFELPTDQIEVVRTLLIDKVPQNRDLVFGATHDPRGKEIPDRLRTYVVDAKAGITGDYLVNAAVSQDPQLRTDYFVTMDFDARGAQIFEDLTGNNVGRRMAIVLDSKINSAPVIQSKIGGGRARITLGSSGSAQERLDEAKALVIVLKAGALPAPVEIREKRQVGKTLGEESVRKGSLAMIVGILAVVLFMALYYRMSGLLADIALIVNGVLVLACMALFEATLTLPGMAGIVLTLGIAVDANVIILERVREELRLGKTPRAAIDAGYDKAWATIFDSHFTQVIAAVVLLEYGTGPVRGFAVTLLIGIISSLFTSIVITRLVYDLVLSRRRLQTLSV